MTLLFTLLTIAVAVLAVLVAGLLRSHAEILRRLHEAGLGLEDDASRPALPLAPSHGDRDRRPREGGAPAPEAADVVGTTPDGGAHGVRVAGVGHDTVLAFLSSGCDTCGSFWEDLAEPDLPPGTRLVVVTKGEDAESPAAVSGLAPSGVPVVMSSDAWRDYAVPGTPYVVHVDGATGRIRGQGTGGDWDQVRRLFLEANLDTARANGRGRPGRAAADLRREEEIDRVLAANGYVPGDPRLFAEPSAPSEPSGSEQDGHDGGVTG